MSDCHFSWAGEELVAVPERALYWPRERTLFLADLHFGKDATFRQALRWIPPGTTNDDLRRLDAVMARHDVQRLVILGDAFHSEHAGEKATIDVVRAWRSGLSIEIAMVSGNHDRKALHLAIELRINVLSEGGRLGPWMLRHHPVAKSRVPVLCGHVHPVVTMLGPARESLRLPAFWVQPHQCVLPAFGGFTGGGSIRPGIDDRVLIIAGDRVVNAELSRLRGAADRTKGWLRHGS